MPDDGGALDRARLDELTAVDGSGAMLADVIAALEESLDSMLAGLEAHVRAGEITQARELAHVLAGRLLMLGARPAGQSLRHFEQALANGHGVAALGMWPQVSARVAEARAALSDYRGG